MTSSSNSQPIISDDMIGFEYYNRFNRASIIFMKYEELPDDCMICSDCGIFLEIEKAKNNQTKFNLNKCEIKCSTCCIIKLLQISPERLEELLQQRRKLVLNKN